MWRDFLSVADAMLQGNKS